MKRKKRMKAHKKRAQALIDKGYSEKDAGKLATKGGKKK